MIKLHLLLTVLLTSIYAVEIPTEHAQLQKFGKAVELNAQVVQLSNAKQNIMSMVGGHIEKYYVKPAQQVKRGDKVALIESIMLSKMTAEYISLQEQYRALNKNYKSTKKLYDRGMTSQQELNNQSIKRDAMRSQINALRSQLNTMGIQTKRLKKASSDYVLYAHSDGKVSEILQPLHSVINEETPIVTIVKRSDSYIKSFLPLEYAAKVKIGQRVVVHYADKEVLSHVTQIMPEVDQTTQRIVILSSIDDKTVELYINAYLGATLYFDTTDKFVAVNKSALSFFNNEWVVFVPEHHDEHDDGHDDHNDDETRRGRAMSLPDAHDEEEHGHHEEEEVPYDIKVVKIIRQNEKWVAIEGMKEHEDYVSDKSYYIKSLLLKSSLGGHGH